MIIIVVIIYIYMYKCKYIYICMYVYIYICVICYISAVSILGFVKQLLGGAFDPLKSAETHDLDRPETQHLN